MNRVKIILIICCLGILASCKSDLHDSQACGGYCPPYAGIQANDAPSISAFDSTPYFTVCTVTSYSGLLHADYSCLTEPMQLMESIDDYTNANGNNMAVTYTTASSSYNYSYADTGLYLNGILLGYRAVCPYYNLQIQPTSTISFSGPLAWVLQGSHPDTICLDTIIGPFAPTIVSDTVIHINTGYTLTGAGTISGDSVIFILADSSRSVRKTFGPGTTSCTFTTSDMVTFLATHHSNPGLAQIVTYRKFVRVINGVRSYFYKEACFSQYVRIE